MRRFFYRFLILSLMVFLSVMLYIGCKGDDAASNSNDRGPNTGMLRLYLTDLPFEAKEVWITFSEVEVHQTGGGWQSFEDSEQTLDLLTLENTTELVALGPLETGKYTGLRFQISEGHVIDLEDERCDLKVPSNKIHVPVNFEIQEGGTTSVTLDFDAEKSVHVVRRGNNESCILRPVVKPVSVE